MADQSGKHGSRLDDEMKHELDGFLKGAPVEARSDEGRSQVTGGVEEPEVTVVLSNVAVSAEPAGEGAAGLALSAQEVADRFELARHIRTSIFPCDAETVVSTATEMLAPEPVIAVFETLPADRTYDNFQAVWEALGGRKERDLHDPEAELELQAAELTAGTRAQTPAEPVEAAVDAEAEVEEGAPAAESRDAAAHALYRSAEALGRILTLPVRAATWALESAAGLVAKLTDRKRT